MKHTNIKLQTHQDEDMILLFKNIIRGGKSCIFADIYVKSDDNKKVLCIVAYILYGRAMIQDLPYDENNFDKDVKSKEFCKTSDDSILVRSKKLI